MLAAPDAPAIAINNLSLQDLDPLFPRVSIIQFFKVRQIFLVLDNMIHIFT